MKNTLKKRILSILLACVLVLGYLPVPALAEETTAAEETVETTAATVPETIPETEPETVPETEPEQGDADDSAALVEEESILLPGDEQPEGGLDPEGEDTPEDLTFNLTEGGVVIIDGDTEGTVKVIRRITNQVTGDIPATEIITVTGATATCEDGKCREINVETGRPVTIRLRDVRLDNQWMDYHSAMTLIGTSNNPAKVTLILEGENFIRGGRDNAGIRVPEGADLTIRGTGALTAIGMDFQSAGAGIGGKVNENCGTVRIESGTVTATGGDSAAGIGGGGRYDGSGTYGGTVIITGGTVTATGGDNAAGIGGGDGGSGGNITITGGIVTATGGDNAAGIGGGDGGSGGNITITGGIVTATGDNATCDNAPGIGSGYQGSGGNVAISGGFVFEGDTGKVYGNTTLESDFTIPAGASLTIPADASLTISEGASLTIPEDASLTISEGVTLTNYGTVTGGGSITNQGTILNEGTLPSGISGKITHNHNYDEDGFCTRDNCDEPYQPATPADGVYQITNAGNLFWFADYATSDNRNAEAKVTQDITMPEGRSWGGIGTNGYYSGIFDGNDKTITGLTGTEGLVKLLEGTVKNVILKNVNISRGGDNLGAVAGHCSNGSRIENCYSSGTVEGNSWSIGGIAGHMQGNMEGCISECTVSGGTAGGLVGSGARSSAPYPALNNCLYLGSQRIEGDRTHLQGSTLNVFRVDGEACTRYNPSESVTPGTVCGAMYAYSVFQVVADRFQKPVPYINTEGKEENCFDYTPVTETTTSLTDGWYVVEDEVSVSDGITVTGDARLILTDGCRLTVNGGIQIPPDNRLTIYRQAAGTGQIANVSLPVITRQPEAVTMVEGEDRSLSVEYTDGDECQWYRNGEAVEGATESLCSLAALKAGIYRFHCVITTGGFTAVSRSVTVTVTPSNPNPIRFTQEYVTLERGSSGQLALESDSPELLNLVTYRTDSDFADIYPNGETCVVRPGRSGTYYVIAEVTLDGETYSARCRVDVTAEPSEIAVTGVQLGTPALTTELFRTDYAEFDVILLLDQNKNPVMTADSITPDGAVPEDNGVAVESAAFVDEEAASMFDLVVKDDRTLLVVPKQNAIASPKTVAGKYTSKVRVTVDGKEFITDTALKLAVKKSVPKLKAAALTFNSFYTGQSQAIKITGATVTKYVLTEDKTRPEWLDYEKVKDGVLTLTENPTGKNGNVYVTVTAEGWAKDFDVAVPVKLTYAAPKLKLSASSVTVAAKNSQGVSLKLLCGSKGGTLESLNVEDIQVDGFQVKDFDRTDGSFTLIPNGDVVAGTKKVTVSFSDTHQTVSLRLKVTAKAPAIAAKPASVTLNSTAGDSARIPITATPADYRIPEVKLFLTDNKGNELEQQDLLNYSCENGVVTVETVTDKTQPATTYYLHVRTADTRDAVLSVKTLAENKSDITASAKVSGGIDLSFPASTVMVKPTFKNYASGGFTVTEWDVTAYAGKTAVGSARDSFTLDEEEGQLVLRAKGQKPPVTGHTYSLTAALTLDNGRTLTLTNLKLPVKRTPARLKLSKTSISLNKAINDCAVVDVTCQTKGYDFTKPVAALILPAEKDGQDINLNEPENKEPLTVQWSDGKLTVTANSNAEAGKTYKITLKATKNDPAVTLSVKILDTAVTASLKAKGAIDVVRDGTYITVTPSYKNYMGLAEINAQLTIESWSGKKGEDYLAVAENLFDVQFADGTFTITKAPGAKVDTALKYRAALSFKSSTKPVYVNLTVKSGKAKFAVSGTPVLYKADRYSRGTFRITTADATLNAIDHVAFKTPAHADLFQIYDYGNGEFAIGFKDNRIPDGKLPTSVTLNVFCAGNETNTPNAAVTLKLQLR